VPDLFPQDTGTAPRPESAYPTLSAPFQPWEDEGEQEPPLEARPLYVEVELP